MWTVHLGKSLEPMNGHFECEDFGAGVTGGLGHGKRRPVIMRHVLIETPI
jgi:hypothetical protein